MAVIQIPNLPPAVSLSGSAQFECVQGGSTFRTTAQAIANLAVAYPFPGWYGSFYSTSTQTNAGTTTANAITYNQTYSALGVNIQSNSQIIFGAPGIYSIQLSAQVQKTDAGTSLIDIWMSKNGTNVDYTNQRVSISGTNVQYITTRNFYVQVDSQGDYVQLFWSSLDLNVQLVAGATQNNPTRPAIPSVNLTVGLVCDTSAQALQPSASSAIAFYLDNLPTTAPTTAGQFWWNSGVLTQS